MQTVRTNIDRAKVFTQLATYLSDLTNFEAEEVQVTDHLVDDMYLIPRQHLPKIVARFEEAYDIEIEPEMIEDFIADVEEDPDKGTVGELLAVITEELEFN